MHQLRNGYFNDSTTGYAIRVGDYKLIAGDPGDSRVLAWPQPLRKPVAFGASGGHRDDANDACRAPSGKGDAHGHSAQCVDKPCLFNVVDDPSESVDLAANKSYTAVLARLQARWAEVSRLGPSTEIAYPYGPTSATVKTREQTARPLFSPATGSRRTPLCSRRRRRPRPGSDTAARPRRRRRCRGRCAASGVRGAKKNHDNTDVAARRLAGHVAAASATSGRAAVNRVVPAKCGRPASLVAPVPP